MHARHCHGHADASVMSLNPNSRLRDGLKPRISDGAPVSSWNLHPPQAGRPGTIDAPSSVFEIAPVPPIRARDRVRQRLMATADEDHSAAMKAGTPWRDRPALADLRPFRPQLLVRARESITGIEDGLLAFVAGAVLGALVVALARAPSLIG